MAIKVGTTAFDLIMRYARKRLASPNAEGIMEVMSNKQAMDFVKDLIEEFNLFGVPESAITKVDDVGVIANEIMNIKQKKIMEAFKKQMTPKKSAQVFDLQGNKIDTSKGIMAGRQIPETEAQIKTKIDTANKKGIANLRQQKMVDGAIDNSSPGFSGDTKYDAQLVAEDLAEKMYGKEFYDLSQKQQSDLYGQAYDGLAKQRFKGLKKPEPEDKADGGRIGYKIGSIDKGRRAFLKLMGGAAAGIGALKTGALKMFGKETAKNIPQVVTTPPVAGKPAWFDSLVNKVIAEGDDVTKQFAVKDRELVNTKQINEFAEVTVYRDLDTNTVRVNYGSKLRLDPSKPYEKGNISRAVNDSDQIDLIVREGEVIEPVIEGKYKGTVGRKTQSSFEASEAEPRSVGGPEDADIEFDGERIVNNVDDLMEDVSPLEEYATGKKLTGDKAAKAQKKREAYERFTQDQMEQAEYLETKYGPGPEPDDFASGGLAGMLGE